MKLHTPCDCKKHAPGAMTGGGDQTSELEVLKVLGLPFLSSTMYKVCLGRNSLRSHVNVCWPCGNPGQSSAV